MADFEFQHRMLGFDLLKFVNENFIIPNPTDYKSDANKDIKNHVADFWNALKHNADTVDYGSKVLLPKPYIVPGGRFRELHYWDSYFSILGLQACQKVDLIENIVENFAHLITTEGYIPTGNRTYYLGRSQPPFFSLMVQLLAEIKGDEIYAKYLPALEKEYAFWMDGKLEQPERTAYSKRRVLHIDKNTLNRYFDDNKTPRPESYKQDLEIVKNSIRPHEDTYRNIRAATESGWDFSSRWLDDGISLSTIHTTDIVPIDLNALLYNLEMVLLKANIVAKKNDEAAKFETAASSRREALRRYCWNGDKGMFFDFDFQRYKILDNPSLATVYPLFFKMVSKRDADRVAKAIDSIFLRPGGVVTTPNNSGQQWDAPNGWAPLQWMTIKGLRNYGHDSLANVIKERWIDLNIKIYQTTGKLFEKYNVEDFTMSPNSGEYPTQEGFGWTNGVLLKLLSESK
jgi:alpha,alpha-trehalase